MEKYGLEMAKPRLERPERESWSVENVVANRHMPGDKKQEENSTD